VKQPILQRSREGALRTLRNFISLRWVRDIWMYLVRIIERMEDNHIFLSAAGISFNALLCFIPLILLVFYALGFYLDTAAAIEMVDTYLQKLELFPYQREQLRGMVINLIEEFVGGSQLAGVLGGIGLIWTSSALFAALRTVLNRIFDIQDTKNIFVSKLKDFAMLSIVGMALVFVTVFLYGISVIKGIGEDVFGIQLDSWIFNDAINIISPFILSFILFSLVFYLLPDRKMSLRIIITSSSVAALLWGVAKFVFAYYLEHLWKIGTIYGPYAIIVATAIWVYYSSMTVLFAAEVAEMASERRELKRLFSDKSLQNVIEQSKTSPIGFPAITPDSTTDAERD